MRLVASDGDSFELPPGHRFPSGKYLRVRAELEQRFPDRIVASAPAPWEDLALVHDPRWLAELRGGLCVHAERRLGLPWSEALVRRARRSVGGTLAAMEWALVDGAAGHLAGGTHHAFRDRGEGFCALNDVAVAIAVARRDHGLSRFAVVDLDVHQGNGTAALFADDPDVLSVSLHGANNYPFRKEQSSLDVPLPDGTEDAAYLRALDEALEIVPPHRPDVIFYQAGVDPLRGDRFGRLALTHDGLGARDRRVYALARRMTVPLVVVMGGGYHPDIALTVAAHVQVYTLLLT